MKLIDIDPIIKAIEARQENAEDLPPLTTGDFLRMLREVSEQETGGIQLIIKEDGTAEKYDDTYDLMIHCTSEDEQKEVLKIMNQAAKLRKPHGRLIDEENVIDAIHERLKVLQTHEVFRRKRGDIDLLGVMPYIAKIPTAIEPEEGSEE